MLSILILSPILKHSNFFKSDSKESVKLVDKHFSVKYGRITIEIRNYASLTLTAIKPFFPFSTSNSTASFS